MTAPYRIVAVSGSVQEPSKTTAVVTALAEAVAARIPAEVATVELAQWGPVLAGALSRDQLHPDAEAQVRAIEQADLLVVGSPVYRASFSGLFKHLFDLVDQYALVGTPVLLAATGGGERHALIIEHQLRPLFSFFQALTLPLGVYASHASFDGTVITDESLRRRIDLAAERSIPLLPHTPNVTELVAS
ncbi:FMN reductase [Microbacterium sp. YY-01]|uniref:FMN reductase n=1 Tax=Microbacterium sp. YY-01 TaxID=3421634 RepID=UPI003D171420